MATHSSVLVWRIPGTGGTELQGKALIYGNKLCVCGVCVCVCETDLRVAGTLYDSFGKDSFCQ